MKVKFYGTRGSVPIARKNAAKFGGNTTCLRVMSPCLPEDVALVVDSGSGFVPLSDDLLREGVMKIRLLQTHYHHDHTQGLPLAIHPYLNDASIWIWGPKQDGVGPQEVFGQLMSSPYFPADFAIVRHRFQCHGLDHIGTQVMLVHPQGGFKLVPVHIFRQAETGNGQLAFHRQKKFAIEECLVIWMHKAVHPEYTVSYRFEERPTGRVFVFLTDHENTDGFPQALLAHLRKANLLVQDCQYSREVYEARTAGYGHGTPDYCVRSARVAMAEVLALTHHDPRASDKEVLERLGEAHCHAEEGAFASLPHVCACADYDEVDV